MTISKANGYLQTIFAFIISALLSVLIYAYFTDRKIIFNEVDNVKSNQTEIKSDLGNLKEKVETIKVNQIIVQQQLIQNAEDHKEIKKQLEKLK